MKALLKALVISALIPVRVSLLLRRSISGCGKREELGFELSSPPDTPGPYSNKHVTSRIGWQKRLVLYTSVICDIVLSSRIVSGQKLYHIALKSVLPGERCWTLPAGPYLDPPCRYL